MDPEGPRTPPGGQVPKSQYLSWKNKDSEKVEFSNIIIHYRERSTF